MNWPWKVAAPVLAGVAYVIGLAAHEGTHVVMVWLTGGKLRYVSMVPPEVGYAAPSQRADSLIRFSTIIVTVPLLVAYMLWLSEDLWSWRLLGLAVIGGYIPRSNSDWEPLTQWVKYIAVKQ